MEHLNWYVCAKNRKLQITVSWLLCNSMFFFEFYCCEFLLLLLFELKIQKLWNLPKTTETNELFCFSYWLSYAIADCLAHRQHTHTHSIAHNDVYVYVCVVFKCNSISRHAIWKSIRLEWSCKWRARWRRTTDYYTRCRLMLLATQLMDKRIAEPQSRSRESNRMNIYGREPLPHTITHVNHQHHHLHHRG